MRSSGLQKGTRFARRGPAARRLRPHWTVETSVHPAYIECRRCYKKAACPPTHVIVLSRTPDCRHHLSRSTAQRIDGLCSSTSVAGKSQSTGRGDIAELFSWPPLFRGATSSGFSWSTTSRSPSGLPLRLYIIPGFRITFPSLGKSNRSRKSGNRPQRYVETHAPFVVQRDLSRASRGVSIGVAGFATQQDRLRRDAFSGPADDRDESRSILMKISKS